VAVNPVCQIGEQIWIASKANSLRDNECSIDHRKTTTLYWLLHPKRGKDDMSKPG
jgi:hypothetical protein